MSDQRTSKDEVPPASDHFGLLQWHLAELKKEVTAVYPDWNRVMRLFDEAAQLKPVHEPRTCNHGAVSPKGTMFYHGFVGEANHWRCDVCKGIYAGNLTEPNTVGSQALTLVSTPPPRSRPAFDVNYQAALVFAVRELLGSLPKSRDWLNPDAERVFREYLSDARQHMDVGTAQAAREVQPSIATLIELFRRLDIRVVITAFIPNGLGDTNVLLSWKEPIEHVELVCNGEEAHGVAVFPLLRSLAEAGVISDYKPTPTKGEGQQ